MTNTHSTNECGHSTMDMEETDASPLISDCQQLAHNIRGDGRWKVNLYDGWKRIASYGTCAFTAVSPWGELGGWIGNEDVRDLIFDAIGRSKRSDRVGARGEMPCCCAQATLEWAIAHT